jgi:hypothetical protein
MPILQNKKWKVLYPRWTRLALRWGDERRWAEGRISRGRERETCLHSGHLHPSPSCPTPEPRRREQRGVGEGREMHTSGPPTTITVFPYAKAKESKAEESLRGWRAWSLEWDLERSESKEGEWERWERRIRMRTWLIKGVNTCWIKNSSPKTRDQCRLLIQPDSVNYFIIADCFKIRQEYSFFLQTSRGICICVGFFQFQQWWPVGTMVYV